MQRTPPNGMACTQWLDYKRTWRTLVSCLAWVSATLGVVLNSDWQASYAALQEFDLDNTDVSDLVQLEMAKIATLKANMIGDIATFKSLPTDVISRLHADLGDWHARLPDTMRLTNLLQRGIAEEPRLQVCLPTYLILLCPSNVSQPGVVSTSFISWRHYAVFSLHHVSWHQRRI